MCLILFAYQKHPDYRLIIAANRDEFYCRSTQAAHFWEESPDLLAGKDLEAGGTWMGITRSGRFAAVTNFRDVTAEDDLSACRTRGELTQDFLLTTVPPREYLLSIAKKADQYKGFNLLVGDLMTDDRDGLCYFCNRGGTVRSLSPAVYGLSNSFLNIPWPKVTQGRQALAAALNDDAHTNTDSAAPAALDHRQLMQILQDSTPAADSDLPHTGISLEFERALSSRFIKTDDYGTRSSTVLTVGTDNCVEFTEHTVAVGENRQEPGYTSVNYRFVCEG